MLSASFTNLLGGEAIQWWGGHSQHAEHEIDLSPVVDLVLDHRPEPFPGRHGDAGRGLDSALEARIPRFLEDLDRLRMHLIKIPEDLLVAVRQLTSVARISARQALNVLREHVSLRGPQVPDEVSEGEFALGGGPFEAVRRDAFDDPAGAFADILEIGEESVHRMDFNRAIASWEVTGI